jgi:hypothetical protein
LSFLIVVFVVAAVVFLGWLYFTVRRDWVFRVRVRVLIEEHSPSGVLPSYEDMVFRYWWVWSPAWFTDGRWQK